MEGRAEPPSVGQVYRAQNSGTGPSPVEHPRLFCSNIALRHFGPVFDMAINPDDYYVITSPRGEYPHRWSWEMRRKSKPLGIKMTADGFQSEMAAQFAGKRAGRFSGCPIERRAPRPKVRPPQLATSFSCTGPKRNGPSPGEAETVILRAMPVAARHKLDVG